VGTWNLGCFASAILTIFIGDYLGRRKTLMLGLSFWVAGEIIQCSSFSFGQFIAGRAVAGFGMHPSPSYTHFEDYVELKINNSQETASQHPPSPPTKSNA
jgi:hypothetical protein